MNINEFKYMKKYEEIYSGKPGIKPEDCILAIYFFKFIKSPVNT